MLDRFTYYFGDQPPHIPLVQGIRPGSDGDHSKISVLVVDDETLIADTLADILYEHGFEARKANSAEEAIEIALRVRPDIVLTDVLMPRMSGVDLGIRIRRELPGTQIVLISGQASTADLLQKAQDEGNIFELLPKPIHPEELIARLRGLVN
ncbi:response regulator [Terracidiphilus gabretensis]|uniref:response regulator n=1 Tax=Terracidiphilus gabretensis TaxID=1577687 RepID=UPI0009E98D71|nr:response regulator [Terracidiphilus gabretensis]